MAMAYQSVPVNVSVEMKQGFSVVLGPNIRRGLGLVGFDLFGQPPSQRVAPGPGHDQGKAAAR